MTPRRIRRAIAPLALTLLAAAGTAFAATHALTRTEAARIAATVELRHSDLPGTKQQPNPSGAEEQRINDGLATCMDQTAPVARCSRTISRRCSLPGPGEFTVVSGVSVAPSPAAARRDLAATATSCPGLPAHLVRPGAALGTPRKVSFTGPTSTAVGAARGAPAAAFRRPTCACDERRHYGHHDVLTNDRYHGRGRARAGQLDGAQAFEPPERRSRSAAGAGPRRHRRVAEFRAPAAGWCWSTTRPGESSATDQAEFRLVAAGPPPGGNVAAKRLPAIASMP